MIFVTLGTSRNPFHRLLVAVDHLTEDGLLDDVTAQIGRTPYIPIHYSCTDFLELEDQIEHIRRAEFVITHGGEGTLEECLALKKKVIVVPRRADRGEAPDDHQMEIADFLERADRALVVREVSELEQAVTKVSNWEPLFAVARDDSSVVEVVRGFIDRTIREKRWRKVHGHRMGT